MGRALLREGTPQRVVSALLCMYTGAAELIVLHGAVGLRVCMREGSRQGSVWAALLCERILLRTHRVLLASHRVVMGAFVDDAGLAMENIELTTCSLGALAPRLSRGIGLKLQMQKTQLSLLTSRTEQCWQRLRVDPVHCFRDASTQPPAKYLGFVVTLQGTWPGSRPNIPKWTNGSDASKGCRLGPRSEFGSRSSSPC